MKALGDVGERGVEGRRETKQPDREERERKDRQKEKGVAKGKKNMQTTFSAFTSDASCNELYIYHHL